MDIVYENIVFNASLHIRFFGGRHKMFNELYSLDRCLEIAIREAA